MSLLICKPFIVHSKVDSDMKLSIIVPVYNVEGYLLRCLDSCMQQDIPQGEYEIIIVNDGSTDGSLSIAKRYSSEYSNIIIISQQNGGLSRARNAGLERATGEYIWFVDSDDYIAENCLGSLLHQCKSMNLDLLAFCTARVTDSEVKENRLFGDNLAAIVLDGPTAMRRGLIKKMGAQLFIIRKAFLEENQLSFFPGLLHEDEEFVPRMYYLASRISYTSSICYYSYVRMGSIMQTFNPKRLTDMITVMDSLHRYSQTIVSRHRYLFSQRIALLIDASFKLCRSAPEEEARKFEGKLRENIHLVKHLLHSRLLKFQIVGALLLCFPHHMLDIYTALLKLTRR